MRTLATCSFCHALGEPGSPCPDCGHQVGVSRLDCRCPACAPQTTAVRGRFVCRVCHVNSVDALGGFDTCADCLDRQ
ncbi:MAG TPA: hypothetical protein VKA46_00310 [Gemmataceae bacterium]|nr:hypothetical protein [Gemmataceae bacterium]